MPAIDQSPYCAHNGRCGSGVHGCLLDRIKPTIEMEKRPTDYHEVVVRMHGRGYDGIDRVVEVGLSADDRYDELLEIAHRNADGSLPPPGKLGAAKWSAARRVQLGEQELRRLCGKDR